MRQTTMSLTRVFVLLFLVEWTKASQNSDANISRSHPVLSLPLLHDDRRQLQSSGETCDASSPPINGEVGTCHATLLRGSFCQPICHRGYTASGSTYCTNEGMLSKATCVPLSIQGRVLLPDDPVQESYTENEYGRPVGIMRLGGYASKNGGPWQFHYNGISGAAVDPSNEDIVALSGGSYVVRYSISKAAATHSFGGLNVINGIEVGTDGSIWVGGGSGRVSYFKSSDDITSPTFTTHYNVMNLKVMIFSMAVPPGVEPGNDDAVYAIEGGMYEYSVGAIKPSVAEINTGRLEWTRAAGGDWWHRQDMSNVVDVGVYPEYPHRGGGLSIGRHGWVYFFNEGYSKLLKFDPKVDREERKFFEVYPGYDFSSELSSRFAHYGFSFDVDVDDNLLICGGRQGVYVVNNRTKVWILVATEDDVGRGNNGGKCSVDIVDGSLWIPSSHGRLYRMQNRKTLPFTPGTTEVVLISPGHARTFCHAFSPHFSDIPGAIDWSCTRGGSLRVESKNAATWPYSTKTTFEVRLDIGFPFKRLVWSGQTFSSGGSGCVPSSWGWCDGGGEGPNLDWPSSNKRFANSTTNIHSGDDCKGTGEPQFTFDMAEAVFDDNDYYASWFVGDDGGSTCGGPGGWIELTYVAIELAAPADLIPPEITWFNVSKTASSITLSISMREHGVAFFIIQEESEMAPAIDDVLAGRARGANNEIAAGKIEYQWSSEKEETTINGMKDDTTYAIYVAATDITGNPSNSMQKVVVTLPSLPMCTASSDSTKDGSDGSFYCVNGGSIGGSYTVTRAACICTACNSGYGGGSCETAGACAASTDPSKDGSDGSFFCINGGTVGGTSGACTCKSCGSGYEGTNCQTASACDNAASSVAFGVAYPCTNLLASGSTCSPTCNSGYSLTGLRSCMAGTLTDTAVCDPNICKSSTSASKDGSDGSFYCINGGTVGGTTGACTCTACDAGYEGSSCEIATACTASTSASKDGSDGSFYCINGGTVGGTTGACTCTACAAGYEGTSCHTASAPSTAGNKAPKSEKQEKAETIRDAMLNEITDDKMRKKAELLANAAIGGKKVMKISGKLTAPDEDTACSDYYTMANLDKTLGACVATVTSRRRARSLTATTYDVSVIFTSDEVDDSTLTAAADSLEAQGVSGVGLVINLDPVAELKAIEGVDATILATFEIEAAAAAAEANSTAPAPPSPPAELVVDDISRASIHQGSILLLVVSALHDVLNLLLYEGFRHGKL